MRSKIWDLGMFGIRNWARRSAGIPNWGHSDLGVQLGRKNQPACIYKRYTVINISDLYIIAGNVDVLYSGLLKILNDDCAKT